MSRRCRWPKISIRSVTSVRAVSTNRSTKALARTVNDPVRMNRYRRVRVTHRFHPLFGQDFEFVAHRQNWSEDRVHLHDENGVLFSLPAGWTDARGAVWGAGTHAGPLSWAYILGVCALPSRLSAHGPSCSAGWRSSHGATLRRTWRSWCYGTRSRSSPSVGPPAAGLGRPRRDRRAGAAAARTPSATSGRDTGHPAGLAPAAGQEEVDLPEQRRDARWSPMRSAS